MIPANQGRSQESNSARGGRSWENGEMKTILFLTLLALVLPAVAQDPSQPEILWEFETGG